MDLTKIRSNYPITCHDIYLNHAATAPIAHTTIQSMQALAAQMARPLSEHFYQWLGVIEDTRRRIAELIHAHSSEIAFCQNTSTGLSLIAAAIPLHPGDKVLVPRNEFPSNIYVWQNLAAKGVICELFDVVPGEPVVETLQKMSLKQVKLLSISAVSYLTGRFYELKDIVTFCRERDILSCIDAIQAVGAVPIDVQDIQVDFLVSGAQKWLLSGVGAGFIYARKEWLEKLTVSLVGWASVQYPENFSLKQLEFSKEMTRFEPGLPNILPLSGLNRSLRDLTALGWNAIYANIQNNTRYLMAGLHAQQIATLAQVDRTAGIVAFEVPNSCNLEKLLEELKKQKIHLTQREQYIRVSPHFYNNAAELDCLLALLGHKANISVLSDLKSPTPVAAKGAILISGGSGHLGAWFAKQLAKQGYALTLLGQHQEKLMTLQQEIQASTAVTVSTYACDFNDPTSLQLLLDDLSLQRGQFTAFINCAGIAESDEFAHLSVSQFKAMLQINCVAAFQLMQLFLSTLRAPKALGILNIVSATGRCGWPLLSGYAASQAAIWSMTEVLAREFCHDPEFTVTTYVAPPLHSPMQKRLGRIALRYFKLSGDFPYKQAQQVAGDAWRVFTKKETQYIHPYHRWILRFNAWIPKIIDRQIKKRWRV